MKSDKLTPIGKLLRNELYDAVRSQTGQAASLEAVWRTSVPGYLADHVFPYRYQHGVLWVRTHSSIWATKLRHQNDKILAQLRQDPLFVDCKTIKVRLTPEGRPAAPKLTRKSRRVTRVLSPAVKAALYRLADDVKDPLLAAALSKLAGLEDK